MHPFSNLHARTGAAILNRLPELPDKGLRLSWWSSKEAVSNAAGDLQRNRTQCSWWFLKETAPNAAVMSSASYLPGRRDSLSSSSSIVPENSIIFPSSPSISEVEPSYSVARLLQLFKDHRKGDCNGDERLGSRYCCNQADTMRWGDNWRTTETCYVTFWIVFSTWRVLLWMPNS